MCHKTVLIAAKVWGNEHDEPILCFHGLMDTAGSFDFLIPLLPQHFRYICIDLPSHGKSSPFPEHVPIYTLNYLFAYEAVMRYFGRDSYIVMGHSYGGQIAYTFGQVYPQKLKKLIMLDTVHLFPTAVSYCSDSLDDKITSFLATEEKLQTGAAPTYTYEEAVEKARVRRNGNTLSVQSSQHLIDRLLIPVGGNRYTFNMDQRLKNFINPVQDFRYIVQHIKASPVKCPILMLLGTESRAQKYYFKDIIKVLKSQGNILIKDVEGDHDVHMEKPENVERYITKFLSTHSKL